MCLSNSSGGFCKGERPPIDIFYELQSPDPIPKTRDQIFIGKNTAKKTEKHRKNGHFGPLTPIILIG
eukprot:TRINITY_DN4219_c0_g1_i1.p1 TRINITY_DN4219_c0_g1~~TRINITY_DN4219_c0_g1_i1.p1  ORF type:complete len:67 (-),score=4.89 TRINITY_DN4219_c0_g1_i1:474-674(-)